MKKMPSAWETDRMIMQEITEADTDFIVELRGNPDVYKYFLSPHPLRKDEHINWLRDKYSRDSLQSCYIAGLKPQNLPIGVFSAKYTGRRKAEVGYILAPEVQGKGLAAEAIMGLEQLCKKHFDITAFTAQIHIDNTPSIKLICRLSYLPKERIGDFIVYQKDVFSGTV